MLKQNEHVAQRICLEVTEVGAIYNTVLVEAFLQQARDIGVKVALDDFGAGYSNFRYAIDFSADAIKLDGGIIRDMPTSYESYCVAKAIIEMTHDLGSKAVAEWVEDAAALQIMYELGVDFVQGYAVSKPLNPEKILTVKTILDLILSNDVKAVILQNISITDCP